MNDLKNFKNFEQKSKFYQILWNGIQSFLSISLIIFAGMWFLGITENSNYHYACNAEQVSLKNRQNYFLQDGNYFNGGNFQNCELAFEGNCSMKLNAENQFGFGFDYEFLKGSEEVVIWVWRYAEGDWITNGKIIASSSKKFWKAGEEVVERKDNGWEKIQLKFKVPGQLKNEPLNIYCWNPNPNPIYFDDLHLVIHNIEEL